MYLVLPVVRKNLYNRLFKAKLSFLFTTQNIHLLKITRLDASNTSSYLINY